MQPPARCSNHRCVYIDQCGKTHPDPGSCIQNLVKHKCKPGKKHSESGKLHSEAGKTHPDPGTYHEHSESGETHCK